MPDSSPAPSTPLGVVLGGLQALADQDLIDALAARTVALRAAEAEHAALLSVLQQRAEAAHGGIVGTGTEEIGWLLAMSSRSVEHLVGTSEAITDRVLVWQAWHEGRIDRVKAVKIITLLADVPDPQRARLEAVAVGYAEHHTAAQLHRKLIALTCDEDPDETGRKDAIDRREVAVIPAGHGMAWISAYVSAEHAEAFIQSLDQLAASADCADPYGHGDDRSLGQRRADALVGFLTAHTRWDITAQVLIPADMLLGVETSGAQFNGSPVTHALALQLAWSPDARWTRLVTDPLTGVLLDAGTDKYTIPKRLRNAVRLRDQTCRWPGCTRPAEHTDTDHVQPHPAGPTQADNLICLCRHHHREKTFHHWKTTTTSTYAKEITWHGPLGTTRTTRPPQIPKRD